MARPHLKQGLGDKPGDRFRLKRRREKFNGTVTKGCPAKFRTVKRTHQNGADGGRRVLSQRYHVSPASVGKFRVSKQQLRVGLLKQMRGFAAVAHAIGIHSQPPEQNFERLARLRKLVDQQSKSIAFHSFPPSIDLKASVPLHPLDPEAFCKNRK